MTERSKRMTKNLDTLFGNPEDGKCRVCNESTENTTRRLYCSDMCKNVAYSVQRLYLWRSVRRKVFERDNWTCQKCGDRHKDDPSKLEADHIKPISKGGPIHDPTNLQTLCHDCHAPKGTDYISYRASHSGGMTTLKEFAGFVRNEEELDHTVEVDVRDVEEWIGKLQGLENAAATLARRWTLRVDGYDEENRVWSREEWEDFTLTGQEFRDKLGEEFEPLQQDVVPGLKALLRQYDEENRLLG